MTYKSDACATVITSVKIYSFKKLYLSKQTYGLIRNVYVFKETNEVYTRIQQWNLTRNPVEEYRAVR